MKKTLLSLVAGGVVSLLAANPASAALKLIVDSSSVQQPTADVTKYVDVYFNETAPTTNEKMTAAGVYIYLTGPAGSGVGTASGVHFGPFNADASTPAGNPHPFVFPGLKLQDFGSDSQTFVAAANEPNDASAVDVTDGAGVARIPVVIPAGAKLGDYQIQVDDNGPNEFGLTTFGSADPNNRNIAFTSQDGTLTVTPVPEPATLGLFSVAAVGLLARRRKA
jgi:hypothetical protein